MNLTNETPLNEIIESLNAVKTAAKDRHAALTAEVAQLEAAFPELSTTANVAGRQGRPRGFRFTLEQRQKLSESARARWARTNGAAVADTPAH